MLRWTLYIGSTVGVVIVAMTIAGYLLPAAHVASAEARFERAPADVFAVLEDVRRYPEWRPDVSRVDVLSESPRVRWKESGKHGEITFELEDRLPRVASSRGSPTSPCRSAGAGPMR